ncbi:MAG: chromosome segregation protein SMC [Candidatus Eisenbacteria bacterium]|nr:chromosome segregation protein SMC [Candidatus Eisenbacteria bacterium]
MFLKKLKVVGFKSFNKKLELEFGPGITAIVGPNGCGKSNIVDSIRWVLGEQSAKTLRGHEMEDVIFNGTVQRKPLGMADVSLTISNTRNILPVEYSEVEIGRRVFRSGESEYSLNRNTCRLKDIRDLFLDTGMGVQAYSIIERDMVESILADSGGARRFLLDEASGIMKYKVRRKEALGKLSLTEQDIIRVNDIIGELEKEVRSLRRQVGKARRYKRLEEELKRVGIALGVMKMGRLSLKEKELSQDEEKEKEKRDHLAASLLKMEADCEELRVESLKGETELRKTQFELNARERELEEIVREIMVLDARKGGILERLQEGVRSRERIDAKLEETRIDGEEVEKASLEAEANLAREAEELRGLEAVLAEVDSILFKRRNVEEEARKTVLESFQATVQKRAELERSTSRLSSLSDTASRLADEKVSLKVQLDETESLRLGLKDNVESKRSHVDELRSKIVSSREKLIGIDESLRTQRIEERKKGEELAGVSSRLETLRELNASFEGYETGVRRLMLENQHPGLVGVVANLIEVEHGLLDALEAALGNSLQYVVTQTAGDAFSCMDWLSSKKAGKVTFLPLQTLRNVQKKNPPDWILREPGVLGAAVEKVRAGSELQGVLNFLLNGVLIVENRQTATRIADAEGSEDIRLVTLDGEFISAKGHISGGEKLEGFLERKDELKRLEVEKTECTRLLEGMRARILEEEIEKEVLNRETSELEVVLSVAMEALLQMEKEYHNLTSQVDHIQRKIDEVEENSRVAQGEIGELEGRASLLRSELLSLETGNKEDEAALTQAALDVKEFELKKEEVQEAVGEKKMSWVRVASRSKELTSSIERIERLREGLLREREQEEIEGRELESSLLEIEKRAVELGVGGEEARKKKEECESLLSEIEKTHKETQISVGLKESEVKSARGEVDSLIKRVHWIELGLLEVRTESRALKESALSEFGIDVSWPAEQSHGHVQEGLGSGQEAEVEPAVTGSSSSSEAAEEITEEGLSRRYEFLKGRFKALGPVNLLAVDEFDAKKQRLGFLDSQRTDLVEAKEKLLDVINTINETARKLFMETFQTAGQNFSQVFSTLFEGGNAELILVGEDPLEAEIEVVARPRGKVLQRLDLLSGGEKALTAIAFLLGLYLVKSSPFCILDEVDAPLDDANIDRFTSLLKLFCKNTQFIVITHNKRTMEVADRLYGVTMAEPGVSTVVSVQFDGREAEKKEIRKEIREEVETLL